MLMPQRISLASSRGAGAGSLLIARFLIARFLIAGFLIVGFLAAAGISFPSAALGVIEAELPLAKLVADSDAVVVLKVDGIDATRPGAYFTLERKLAGKVAIERLAVLLSGEKERYPKDLLDRLAVGDSWIAFVTESEGLWMALAYSEGTWFHMTGRTDETGKVRWRWKCMEPYLRRSFAGTNADLEKVLADHFAGKGKLPPVDPKAKPGLGPAKGETAAEKPKDAASPAP